MGTVAPLDPYVERKAAGQLLIALRGWGEQIERSFQSALQHTIIPLTRILEFYSHILPYILIYSRWE